MVAENINAGHHPSNLHISGGHLGRFRAEYLASNLPTVASDERRRWN
jgi:hypothetical protein